VFKTKPKYGNRNKVIDKRMDVNITDYWTEFNTTFAKKYVQTNEIFANSN
jgi:hypothetical protein